jgi:flagellar capping protein FliD
MNVNSTTSTTSASSNGLSGLVSGMDTDSMVEDMLSGIQSKIDKQKQKQQTLTWKQEQYREVITKINDFQDKYFSTTSSTSLRSASLFTSSVAQSSSSAVKIISASNSAGSEFSVNVKSLATAASVTSSKVSKNNITLSNTVSDYSRKVTFSYKDDDENEKTLDIDLALLKDENGTTDKEAFANALNEKLDGTGIKAVYTPADGDNEETLSFVSADKEFKISGSNAGLKMIGYSSAVSSSSEKDDDGNYVTATNGFNPDVKINGEVTISLDGVSKKFTLEEGQTIKDIDADEIKKAFGSGISITDDGNGNTVISANGSGRTVSINASDELLETLGVTSSSKSSRISLTSKVSEISGSTSDGKLNINGIEIEYSADDTISQVLSKVNNSDAGVKISYDSLADTFSITNSSLGSDFELSVEDDGNFLSALGFNMNGGSVADIKAGTNAVMDINGVEVERAGNKISYEGVTFELKSVTDGAESATITSEKNVDKIMTVIKDFVNDYNTLIADLNEYTHQEATYKDYAPLTDAQKKEMTEREIELWEEKSKTGLLRNDSDISKFLQNMRSAIYTKGSDSSLVLSNIGIDSSSDWKDYGKLSIDEDTLKKALENNSEAISDMFTNSTTGLATRLNDICKSAANTSSGSPGTLVSLAGVVGKATENDNTIYDELQRISEKLESLNSLYEKRKEKYWNMFNTMETTISNYDSQSSYLSQLTA